MNIAKLSPLILVIVFCFFKSNVQAQFDQDLGIYITDGMGDNGDQVCVDFNVENFDSIISMSFSISFDASVISAQIPSNFAMIPSLSAAAFNTTQLNKGFLSFIWLDDAIDLPDGTTLFSICFDLIGAPGSTSPIFIDDTNIDIEIGKEKNGDLFFTGNLDREPGSITVTASDLTIVSGRCDATSNASTDGTLRFYPTGGAAPYAYSINGPGLNQSGNTSENEYTEFTNLAKGTYMVRITDANGSTSKNIVISDNLPIVFGLNDLQNPTCAWQSPSGVVEISEPSGGFGPYTYEWSNFQFNSTRIEGLAPGDYTVTVTDRNKCTATETYTLTHDTLRLEFDIFRPETCLGSGDGQVKVLGTGGTPNDNGGYELWVKSPNWRVFTGIGADATSTLILEDGDELRIRDSLGCSTDAIVLDMTHTYDVEFNTTISEANCFGDVFDTIRSIPFLSGAGGLNGSGNFTFTLLDTSGNRVMPAGGVLAGEYIHEELDYDDTLFLKAQNVDFPACFNTDTIVLTPTPPKLEITSAIFQPTCDSILGNIEITAMGGTPQYSYNWADGAEGASRDSLLGGDYKVTVIDTNGCTETADLTIMDVVQFEISSEVLKESNCETATGSAIVLIPVEIDIFNVTWFKDNVEVGSSVQVDNLLPGEYIVMVDNFSCSKSDTIIISSFSSILIDSTSTLQPLCSNNGSTGSLAVFASGGDSDILYEWKAENDNTVLSTSSILTGVPSGNYNVIVYDTIGCSTNTTLTLFNNDTITVSVSNIISTTCFGLTDGQALATATGGPTNNGTYDYIWSGGVRADNVVDHNNQVLSQADRWVIAFDGQCFSDTTFFEMEIVEQLTVDLVFESPTCFGDCDGSAVITPTGGNGGYEVLWLELRDVNGDILRSDSLTDLCAGIYHIAIRDINDCQNIDSIELVEPDTLIALLDSNLLKNISCKSDLGQLGIATTGGIGAYNYLWSNSSSITNIASDLIEGDHFITVTDAKGCQDTISGFLSADARVTATLNTPNPIDCFGGQTCLSIASVSGGSGSGYSFQINQGLLFSADSCIEVFAGTYFVSVFDDTGCTVDTTIIIDQPEEISAEVGPDIELELGAEFPEIEVLLNSNSGSIINTVSWSFENGYECLDDICSTIKLTDLADGILEARITDSDGCEAEDDLLLSISTKRNVYFSNIFSPNNDNFNDNWLPTLGLGTTNIEYLQIFDRWGNKVYSIENIGTDNGNQFGWDGKYNGKILNPGVFVYITKVGFIDGNSKEYQGSITLVK